MAFYSLEISRSAQKEVRKLPSTIRAKIVERINSLPENPRPLDCEKLTGSKTTYRVRYSMYRIIYTVLDKTLIVFVIKVGHRKDVYRNK